MTLFFKEVRFSFQSGIHCTGKEMESYSFRPRSPLRLCWAVCLLLQGPGKCCHWWGQRRSTSWLSYPGKRPWLWHSLTWARKDNFKSWVSWGLRNICRRGDSCKRACRIWKHFALCAAWDCCWLIKSKDAKRLRAWLGNSLCVWWGWWYTGQRLVLAKLQLPSI